MKQITLSLATLATTLFLSGCSDSGSDTPPSNAGNSSNNNNVAGGASASATSTTTNAQAESIVRAAESLLGEQARNLLPQDAGVPATGSDAPVAARVLGEVAKGGGADWEGLLKSVATDNTDALLNSIGGDLGRTAASLKNSLEGNAPVTGALDTAVRSLLSGQDSEALGLYDKLTKAGLTEDQKELATELRDLTAAFLTQKNLSALDGAEGRVATLVNALRKGEVAAALPAVKELASNASLTPAQKGFLETLAGQYAPGLSAITEKVTSGLPELPSVPKLGN